MKRVLSFIAAILVFFSVFSITGCKRGYSGKTESTDNPEELSKASEETLKLAESAIQKLERGLVFELTLCVPVDRMYETAKWTAPEISELETKKDASVAFIELYEELLSEYRAYDIDKYLELTENQTKNELNENTAFLYEGGRISRTRTTIEALLSYDCFYKLLEEKDVSRMINDFEEYAMIEYSSYSKHFANVSRKVLFYTYRDLNKNIDLYSVPSRYTYTIYFNGFEYHDNGSVNTTSGLPVTKWLAQSELDDTTIQNLKKYS